MPPGDDHHVCQSCKTPRSLDCFAKRGWRRGVCYLCLNEQQSLTRLRQRSSIETFSKVLQYRCKDRGKKLAARGIPQPIEPLTSEWILQQWEIQAGACFYSGVPMETKSGPRLVTVERLDTKKGYDMDNCVLACFAVNMMRRHMVPGEFTWWCDQVSKSSPFSQQSP